MYSNKKSFQLLKKHLFLPLNIIKLLKNSLHLYLLGIKTLFRLLYFVVSYKNLDFGCLKVAGAGEEYFGLIGAARMCWMLIAFAPIRVAERICV